MPPYLMFIKCLNQLLYEIFISIYEERKKNTYYINLYCKYTECKRLKHTPFMETITETIN